MFILLTINTLMLFYVVQKRYFVTYLKAIRHRMADAMNCLTPIWLKLKWTTREPVHIFVKALVVGQIFRT